MLIGKYPDKSGKFGKFGGKFIPEILIPAVEELEKAYLKFKDDPKFKKELDYYLKHYAGRPTPLTYCENMSKDLGLKIYLKREDLLHTGAHKLNNTIGQALLAKKMGKRRIVAETGAGQHGVATATAAALFGMECQIYMGIKDYERQRLNVFRMELLGAKVTKVYSGSQTLKDAINEAIRDWITNLKTTHYLLGSVLGPHPYPMMIRDFQSIIGKETKEQILKFERRLPDAIIACVGGGSNAIGIFYPFLDDEDVELIGVEAGGKGIETGEHAARFATGREGVLHGTYTYVLQDEYGQILDTHSIAAGLDYPAIGPEHALLREIGRAKYYNVKDEEALYAFEYLSKMEGIIPALESAHAVAWLLKNYEKFDKNDIIVINLSGRGDKDVQLVAKLKGVME